MLRFNKILFVILAGFFQFSPFPSYSQEEWTLQKCIEQALEKNLQVKQSQLNAELSKDRLKESVASLLPSINANASHNYSYGRRVDPFTNDFSQDRTLSQNFSISSSVVLFNGLQLQNSVRQSRYDYLAGKYDFEKTKNDISMSVATAFLQVLYAEDLVDISKKQLEASQVQQEKTKKMVDAGSLPRGSLLDVESQAAREELNLVNAQNQLDIAYLTLVQLLEIDSMQSFRIVRPQLPLPDESMLSASAGDIYSVALKNQPEIKSVFYKSLSAQKGLAVAKGGMSPRLSLSGGLGTGYSDARQTSTITGYESIFIGYTSSLDSVYSLSPVYSSPVTTPFNDQVNDNLNKTIGLNLSIPIFNGWQTKTAISRARISLEIARLQEQQAQNQLRKTIQQAHADAIAALKKYKASEKSVTALRESFRYAEQKFNAGMVSTLDYLNAKNNLARSEADLVQSKYDYIFKIKILEFYQGRPLAF
jgi:outer membrane protein